MKIDEVQVHDLALHADARGWLMEMAKAGADGPIAYCYATVCYPGVVKAWHRHTEHTDRLACVSGMARVVVAQEWGVFRCPEGQEPTPDIVFGDSEEEQRLWKVTYQRERTFHPIQEFVIGPLAPKLVVIPPGIWHGFTPAGNEPCVIVNAPDMPYDPEDEERMGVWEIPHRWEEVDG